MRKYKGGAYFAIAQYGVLAYAAHTARWRPPGIASYKPTCHIHSSPFPHFLL